MNVPENEIIKGCLKGDPSSFRTLYKLYAPKMLTVCKRYTHNTTEAEDVLQEGLIIVIEKLAQFKGEGSFEGWIRKIMVNLSLMNYRKKSAMYAVIDINESEIDIPSSEDILSNIASKDLLNMIQELPPVYKMVFNLYSFEGYKHKEIAEMLGITEGTSKSNLSDARAFLKKRINRNLTIAKAVNE